MGQVAKRCQADFGVQSELRLTLKTGGRRRAKHAAIRELRPEQAKQDSVVERAGEVRKRPHRLPYLFGIAMPAGLDPHMQKLVGSKPNCLGRCVASSSTSSTPTEYSKIMPSGPLK
jgi:hypothetical protein